MTDTTEQAHTSASAPTQPLPLADGADTPPPPPASASASISQLTTRLSELTAERDLFKENVNHILEEKYKSELVSKQQLQTLQTQLSSKQNELEESNKQLSQREEDVDALKLAIQKLGDQMSILANTEIRLSNEVRHLKSEKDLVSLELQRESDTHLSKMVEKDELFTRLQAEKTSYLEQVASLTGELQMARSTITRLTPYEDRLTRLQEVESNLRHDIGVYRGELTKFKEIQVKLEQVEIENHKLRKEKERQQQQQQQQAHMTPQTSPLPTPTPATNTNTNTPTATTTHAHPAYPHVDANTAGTPTDSPSTVVSPGTVDALDLVTPSGALRVSSSASTSISGRSGSATPNSHPSKSHSRGQSSTSNSTASAAAHTLLMDQHTQLQSDHDALLVSHSNTVAELKATKAELAALESTCEANSSSLTQLTAKCDELLQAHSEIVANRNYYKRKCESLSSSVDQMLKAQQSAAAAGTDSPLGRPTALTTSSSSSDLTRHAERDRHATEVKKLHGMIHSLRVENKELEAAVQAYKKTLDSNYQLLKHERDANLLLSKSHSSSGGLFGRGSKQAQLLHQFESVRSLANNLSEIIADKDLSIDHLKKSNLILAKRIFDLEKRFEIELQSDEHAFNGRIDIEQEEINWQTSQANSAANSAANSHNGSRRPSQANTPTTMGRHAFERFDHLPTTEPERTRTPNP